VRPKAAGQMIRCIVSATDPKETPSTTGFNVRFLRIGWSASFPIGVAEMGIPLTV
jgi:hypothetical protein